MQDTASSPTRMQPAPITSVQPGGGFGFAVERAWGRLRRGVLRRCFPGHVRRMAALRQGSCSDCPHDIVDPRDLKLFQNVCGYWFRPEDDPYAWRGRLGLARAGLVEIVLTSLVMLPLMAGCVAAGVWLHPAALLPLIALVPLYVFLVTFFRDPSRIIPDDPAVLVSPADGVVTHLEEVADADFPDGKAFRVSIFLSVFNVHVNRVPRSARVTAVTYYPGAFLDARSSDCPVRNEQMWLDFEDACTGALVRVRQIAGAIARRIVCTVKPGELVKVGDRFGMIKFGSRTEVLVPARCVAEVKVAIGQAVRGGSDVLLRLHG